MTFLIIFALTANRAVDELFVFVSHVVESTGSASSFGGNVIYCIDANIQNHVVCMVERGRIWVAGAVVEEVVDCFHCFLSARVGLCC